MIFMDQIFELDSSKQGLTFVFGFYVFIFSSLSFSVSVLFGNKGIAVVVCSLSLWFLVTVNQWNNISVMFRWQFGLLDLKGLALIWIFICMVCWTGFEEILMGKLALSLVSLNQSQGTGLYIEMVCTMGGIMETGTVRRFICHSVIERLTRTLTLIFCVHDQQNSRSGGCWDGLYEWRRKERSWFSIIVSIVDDLSGGIGLYVIIMMEFWWYIENMYIFIVCNSIILCKLLAGYNIEIVLLLRLCLGIRINLEWRSCEVTVPISAKIGLVFIILIEARAQFLLLLLVLLVSVSFVKEKSGRYEKNVRSKLCWSSREWILELGYHYTRRSCSSGQIKNKFF